MRYRVSGPSGIRVGELAPGTMTFGTAWEWGADEAECGRMLEAFVEAGGNFVDAAGGGGPQSCIYLGRFGRRRAYRKVQSVILPRSLVRRVEVSERELVPMARGLGLDVADIGTAIDRRPTTEPPVLWVIP